MSNKTEKLTVSPMASATIRAFRQVDINSEQVFKIRSVKTGKPVEVKARSLYENEKVVLSKAFDFIENKLKGSSIEEDIQILMKATGFFITGSPHIGAYSVIREDTPMVFLNKNLFSWSNDEFAVTVLHELLHFINISGDDKTGDSLEEAMHDFECYRLLGISVPPEHWAWKKYPQLKDELLSDSAG